jgi:hypothetical protein
MEGLNYRQHTIGLRGVWVKDVMLA